MPAPRASPVFHLDQLDRRLAYEGLDHVLVRQVVRALDGVEGMVLVRVLRSQGGRGSALGGHRVAAHRVDLGDQSDLDPGVRLDCGYGCPEAGETPADNQDVVALELHLPVDSIWTRELTAVSVPFWKPPEESYPGSLPDRADVLVIGGGIAGTSLVHQLGKRRISAVLVERGHLASGASGRNAGFLLAGVADCYAEAVRIFRGPKTREVWSITGENHERMVEAVDGS